MSSRPLFWIIGILAISIAGAGVYKWVDEQGVTHYSASPPPEGGREVELPPSPSPEAVREARERFERMRQEQRLRDEERRIRREADARQELAEKRQRLSRELNCTAAKSALDLFQAPRPIYRFNARCERVFVSDTDRREMIEMLRRFIRSSCGETRSAASDLEAARLADRMKAFNGRYMDMPGEPIAYPDFSDDDLLYSEDFCRCAPVFLREMAKPEYRTPDSEIDKVRGRVRSRCPHLDGSLQR